MDGCTANYPARRGGVHPLAAGHARNLFLTNNSGMTRARTGSGASILYTSALATAAFLADQTPGCSVYALGEAGLLNALYDRGITMNDVNPDYVVIGEARAYSLDTLTDESRTRGREAHRRESDRRTRASPRVPRAHCPWSRSPPASRRISAASRTRS